MTPRLTPNDWDDLTLTASSAATLNPISNTQNTVRGRVWRSVGTGTATWTGTFTDGLPRTASHFSLHHHRTHGGNVRLELLDGDSPPGVVYDSTALPTYTAPATGGYEFSTGTNDPHLRESPFWHYFAETEYYGVRVTFSSFSTTYGADVWQVSRPALGRYFSLGWNPAFGLSLGIESVGDSNRSLGGSLRGWEGGKWRTLTGDLHKIDESERATWIDLMRLLGTSRDFVFDVFPDVGGRQQRDYFMLAKFIGLDALSRQVRVLNKRFQIQEV
jgi:hypothetical protein